MLVLSYAVDAPLEHVQCSIPAPDKQVRQERDRESFCVILCLDTSSMTWQTAMVAGCHRRFVL